MSAASPALEARRLDREHDLGIGAFGRARAIDVAAARFGGDILLGLLWVSADGYAVAVGHRLPTQAERDEARAVWNDARARDTKERLLAGCDHEPEASGPKP